MSTRLFVENVLKIAFNVAEREDNSFYGRTINSQTEVAMKTFFY